MYISAQDITRFTEPPQYNPDLFHPKYMPSYDNELDRVKREKEELQREVDRLQVIIFILF